LVAYKPSGTFWERRFRSSTRTWSTLMKKDGSRTGSYFVMSWNQVKLTKSEKQPMGTLPSGPVDLPRK
jgi:hypothetical protein